MSYNFIAAMSQLTILNSDNIDFPPVAQALTEPDGLLAVGGDLSPTRLLLAYQSGIFPWFNHNEPYLWWSPTQRCVLYCNAFYVNKSFNKFLKKSSLTVTLNANFSAVIQHCRMPRKNEVGTWIDEDMVKAYTQLHTQGQAHSVEVWDNNVLVGGLYGIFSNNVFCGESMFSLVPNASKVALHALSTFLLKHQVSLIDCQISNPHLLSLGAVIISREAFISHLNASNPLNVPICWDTQSLNHDK